MGNFDYDHAINYAFRLLGFRMRTDAEITQRLGRKGFSQETITLVVQRLKELGYLNDFDYVESYVHSNKKHKGRRRIEYELLNKGVAKETIESALTISYSREEEFKAAKLLATKLWVQEKNKKSKFELEEKEKNLKTFHKIAQKLLNRGFSSTIVEQVIKEFTCDSDEID